MAGISIPFRFDPRHVASYASWKLGEQTHRKAEVKAEASDHYLITLNVEFHHRMNLPCRVAFEIGSPV